MDDAVGGDELSGPWLARACVEGKEAPLRKYLSGRYRLQYLFHNIDAWATRTSSQTWLSQKKIRKDSINWSGSLFSMHTSS